MDEAKYRSWISGDARGFAPAFARTVLTGLSVGYRSGVAARNWLFDHGWKRSHHAAVPVISVGNITAGGTGKTPFVAYLVNWFQEQGLQPVILSRGYRALDGQANDEKLVLDAQCPGITHLQNRDRVAAAREAVEFHECSVLILDDGFQHRRLHRDINIVLIDALNPWGFDRLLPRGLLREPITALRRADVAVITRVDQCSEQQREEIDKRLHALGFANRTVEVIFRPRRLMNTAGTAAEIGSLAGQQVVAFCGIGNPASFWKTLTDAGMQVVQHLAYADHHHYTPGDIEHIACLVKTSQATAVVTTQKDLVKLRETELAGQPLWAVEIGAEPVGQIKPLLQLVNSITNVLEKSTRNNTHT